jgi:hypothetical protein
MTENVEADMTAQDARDEIDILLQRMPTLDSASQGVAAARIAALAARFGIDVTARQAALNTEAGG